MAMPSSVSCAQVDDSWRAHALSCRGGFDFTLLFEEVVLGILPIGITLAIIPLRLWHLFRKPYKVVGLSPLLTKLVCPVLAALRLLTDHLPLPLLFPGCMDYARYCPLHLDCTMGSSIDLPDKGFHCSKCRHRRWHLAALSPLIRRAHAFHPTIFSPQHLSFPVSLV